MQLRYILLTTLVATSSIAAEVSVGVDVDRERGVAVAVSISLDKAARVRAAMDAARLSLADAIGAAQREVRGQLVEAELKLRSGQPVYDLEFVEKGREIELRVDARSGEILKLEDEEEDDARELERMLASAKMTLPEAVVAAQREVKDGRAFDAEVSTNGGVRFEIKIMAGPRWVEVMLEGSTGKVIEMRDRSDPLGGWNFDEAPVGRVPPGWTPRQTREGTLATWVVAADPDAVSRPNVLRLAKTENTGQTYNLLVADEPRVADVDLRVHVRADSGEEDQGGGPIWRCQDENNYYICRLNPLESNFRVYKVLAGKRTQLASADIETETHRWYLLRAVMVGNRITCYVDGKHLLTAIDNTFVQPGQVGLWTKADATTSFDDMLLVTPAGPAGTASAPTAR